MGVVLGDIQIFQDTMADFNAASILNLGVHDRNHGNNIDDHGSQRRGGRSNRGRRDRTIPVYRRSRGGSADRSRGGFVDRGRLERLESSNSGGSSGGRLSECVVCREEKLRSVMRSCCVCDHVLCKECAQGMVQATLLGDAGAFNTMRCPMCRNINEFSAMIMAWVGGTNLYDIVSGRVTTEDTTDDFRSMFNGNSLMRMRRRDRNMLNAPVVQPPFPIIDLPVSPVPASGPVAGINQGPVARIGNIGIPGVQPGIQQQSQSVSGGRQDNRSGMDINVSNSAQQTVIPRIQSGNLNIVGNDNRMLDVELVETSVSVSVGRWCRRRETLQVMLPRNMSFELVTNFWSGRTITSANFQLSIRRVVDMCSQLNITPQVSRDAAKYVPIIALTMYSRDVEDRNDSLRTMDLDRIFNGDGIVPSVPNWEDKVVINSGFLIMLFIALASLCQYIAGPVFSGLGLLFGTMMFIACCIYWFTDAGRNLLERIIACIIILVFLAGMKMIFGSFGILAGSVVVFWCFVSSLEYDFESVYVRITDYFRNL